MERRLLYLFDKLLHVLHLNRYYYFLSVVLGGQHDNAKLKKEQLQTDILEQKITFERNNNLTNTEIDLSIVIPAYNAENYLDRCLHAIFAEKTKYHYEVVLVNDGSKDRTKQIAQKYQTKYSNLIYYEQRNAGVAAARNKGVELARGKYLMFVDADDKLERNSIELLMDKALSENADIVEGSYYMEVRGKKHYFRHSYEMAAIPKQKLVGTPWAKVIKKELLSDVQFPVGCEFEDSIFSYLIYPRTQSAVLLPDIVYGYINNMQGLSHRLVWKDSCKDTVYVFLNLMDNWKYFGIQPTQALYEKVLQQMVLNEQRIEFTDKEFQYNAFMVEADAIEKYFPDYVSENATGKAVETFVKHRQFAKYRLYCLYYN